MTSRSHRRAILRRPVHLLVAASLLVAGACSKGGDDEDTATSNASTTTAAAVAAAPLAFAVSLVDTNGTAAPDDATVAAVKKTLDGWLESAVAGPLRSGTPAGDLAPLFTAAAHERLADPATRASLVDEGLPPSTKGVTAEIATAALSSVAGPDGVVAVIAARVDVKVRAVGAASDVDVVHQGDLVLVPDGDGWKIDAFTLHTARDSRP